MFRAHSLGSRLVFHYTFEVRLIVRVSLPKFNGWDTSCGMIDLARLLPRLLRANPELAAQLAWSRAAGEGLRRNAIPVSLNGKTLTVSVADALWQKQLQSMAGELLFRVNHLLGGRGVDEIVFRIAPSDVSRANPPRPETRQKEESSNALPTELLFAAGTIADEDLRSRFLRAADNLIARRNSHLNK